MPRLISRLGVGGVAIGVAFKDISQNFLAGILILVTRPFRVGDQIRFKEYEGTVEDIQTRATFSKTYDGRRAIILQALREAEDVSPDLKADVILVALADFTVNLRTRWWTRSQTRGGMNAQNRVLTSVKQALTEADINLLFPTQQILLHDQTESVDGDRRRQREGWPAGDGEVPEQRGVPRAAPPDSSVATNSPPTSTASAVM